MGKKILLKNVIFNLLLLYVYMFFIYAFSYETNSLASTWMFPSISPNPVLTVS